MRVLGWTFAIWLAFAAVDIAWVSQDAQPQGCDQANHLMRSMEYAQSFRDLDLSKFRANWRAEYGENGVYTYPPLYHIVTGMFLLTIPRPAAASVASNLAFFWLLIYSVIQIGRAAFGLRVGIAGAAVVAAYPMLAQFRHEAFLDFGLTAMTSWCIWRLLATGSFQDRRAAILLGISLGAGLLLKPLIVLFLAAPLTTHLWLHRERLAARSWKNLGLALAATLLVALPWYGPHWRAVAETGAFNQRIAAVERDPRPDTLAGAIFYPHAMASLQTGFAPFVVGVIAMLAFGVRALLTCRSASLRPVAAKVVAAWLLGGLILLTICVLNKDVRYSMPVLPAVALLTASPLAWLRAPLARAAFIILVSAATLPYYTHILFTWPPFHRAVAFRTGSLTWMVWNQRYYYGAAPSLDDWGVSAMLARMEVERGDVGPEHPIRLALVPFLLRLNDNSLRLEALQRGVPLEVYQIGNDPAFDRAEGIFSCDFVLTKTGENGLSFATSQASRIEAFIAARPSAFALLGEYPLPDGSIARLYRIAPQPTVASAGTGSLT